MGAITLNFEVPAHFLDVTEQRAGFVLLTGFLGYATRPASPYNEILAALFGVGAGLTLDEFALWVYLRDVYWAEEGRASFDAVVVAALLGGLIVLGVGPFDLSHNPSSIETLVVVVLVDVLLAAGAILKGKLVLGLVGIFLPFASLAGVLRLAAPRSPWARRWYKADGRKLERSKARWRRINARRKRVADLVAGAPEAPEETAQRGPGFSRDRAG